jgi:hypothetical protein
MATAELQSVVGVPVGSDNPGDQLITDIIEAHDRQIELNAYIAVRAAGATTAQIDEFMDTFGYAAGTLDHYTRVLRTGTSHDELMAAPLGLGTLPLYAQALEDGITSTEYAYYTNIAGRHENGEDLSELLLVVGKSGFDHQSFVEYFEAGGGQVHFYTLTTKGTPPLATHAQVIEALKLGAFSQFYWLCLAEMVTHQEYCEVLGLGNEFQFAYFDRIKSGITHKDALRLLRQLS